MFLSVVCSELIPLDLHAFLPSWIFFFPFFHFSGTHSGRISRKALWVAQMPVNDFTELLGIEMENSNHFPSQL